MISYYDRIRTLNSLDTAHHGIIDHQYKHQIMSQIKQICDTEFTQRQRMDDNGKMNLREDISGE